ncbi:MAG: septation protein A [Burkholderia sp.]|nr:septation protein A [Burkholderia sp.]
MKFFFNILPIIGLFIVFKVSGIFIATIFITCVAVLQIIWILFHHRKIDMMLLVSLTITFILGSTTLILHNTKVIQWKPTILYWIYSTTLVVSRYVFGKNLLEKMIGKKISIKSSIYDKLNAMWAIFFMLLGSGNIYVLEHYTELQWVNFKIFWTSGATIVFVLLQSLWLKKYLN